MAEFLSLCTVWFHLDPMPYTDAHETFLFQAISSKYLRSWGFFPPNAESFPLRPIRQNASFKAQCAKWQIVQWISSSFPSQIFWNIQCRHLSQFLQGTQKLARSAVNIFCCVLSLYLVHRVSPKNWLQNVPSIQISVNSSGLYLAFHVIWVSRQQQGCRMLEVGEKC